MGLLDFLSFGADILNFGHQIENQQYMRMMQPVIWGREDTAIQRRVHDLEAAGLSPTLAAGSAASSSMPINAGAPQLDFSNVVKGATLERTKADIDLAHTQADALDANSWAARVLRDYLVEGASHPGTDKASKSVNYITSMVDRTIADNKRAVKESDEYIRNADLLKSQGLPSNSAFASDTVAEGILLDNLNKARGAGFSVLLDKIGDIVGIGSKLRGGK